MLHQMSVFVQDGIYTAEATMSDGTILIGIGETRMEALDNAQRKADYHMTTGKVESRKDEIDNTIHTMNNRLFNSGS